MIKLTLDTNCFFDYFNRNSKYLQRIIEFEKVKKVELAMTTRVSSDTIDKMENSEIWHRIQTLSVIKIGTGGKYGISKYGGGDFYVGEEYIELEKKIEEIMGNNNQIDIDHLMGHICNKRDIFVTRDKHFLKKKVTLQKLCGVKILEPKDCVDELEKKTY